MSLLETPNKSFFPSIWQPRKSLCTCERMKIFGISIYRIKHEAFACNTQVSHENSLYIWAPKLKKEKGQNFEWKLDFLNYSSFERSKLYFSWISKIESVQFYPDTRLWNSWNLHVSIFEIQGNEMGKNFSFLWKFARQRVKSTPPCFGFSQKLKNCWPSTPVKQFRPFV